MSETDTVFTCSIPGIYDAFLVPLIFEGFADDLAPRVVSETPILETAASSGVLTRALARRMPPITRYIATDLPPTDARSRLQASGQ